MNKNGRGQNPWRVRYEAGRVRGLTRLFRLRDAQCGWSKISASSRDDLGKFFKGALGSKEVSCDTGAGEEGSE